MKKGHFPESISLGERTVAWEVSEIEGKASEGDVIKFINKKFNQLSINDAIT